MNKITLIGIDTSKSVFHFAGIKRNNDIDFRKKVSRNKFLSTLAKRERCTVVMEACAASAAISL